MVDKMSPLRWVRSKEETLSEINRKMQRALEEALMKNIHLQEVRFMWLLVTVQLRLSKLGCHLVEVAEKFNSGELQIRVCYTNSVHLCAQSIYKILHYYYYLQERMMMSSCALAIHFKYKCVPHITQNLSNQATRNYCPVDS